MRRMAAASVCIGTGMFRAVSRSMELSCADGTRHPRPSRRRIRNAIDHLSTRRWFVTLADDDSGSFVQAAWGTQVNLRDGDFLLETKGPYVDGHVATVVMSPEEVHIAFEGFAAGDPSWTDRHQWRPARVGPQPHAAGEVGGQE